MTASAASPTSCSPWQHSLPNHAIKPPVPRLVACKATPQSCLKSKLRILAPGRLRLPYRTHALRHSSTQALRHPCTWHSSTQALGHSIPQPSSTQALRIQALRHSGTQTLGHSGIPHTTLAGRSRSSSCHYSLNILHTHLCSCRLGSALSLPRRPKPILVLLRSSSTPSMFCRPKPILPCHHFLNIF